ncbi:2-C-methyl-D-erythritol 4-phosphate cytidylyltransferase [Heyndrickxia acidiproducens]|jgi:2-C-methyl-D-erythritol 4-phosphate cytidylyltransferase|uniref:2-C-methyl-D-erythritol 4-phosphate cytidylyltransferase n=1 Tax=Heyndrickxia acidiproducens TaxID=1121084 RepID=UPI0003607113|nr:2-C-methyl-D-erythritol 4-phosphate cytidylyltransferase [Heyndrickxia acidiproducens]
MDYDVIIPAAGQGKRMGAGMNKLFLELDGRPVIARTAETFLRDPDCRKIILPVQPQDRQKMSEVVNEMPGAGKIAFTCGGDERQYSVYHGLGLAGGAGIILVHDGARPFIQPETIRELVRAAAEKGAAIAAVPVKDTIKRVKGHTVTETVERSSLWQVQTPQAFRMPLLKMAHEKAAAEHFLGTDEASLVERLSIPVHIVMGSYDNIKITTPEDLYFAEAILKKYARKERRLYP